MNRRIGFALVLCLAFNAQAQITGRVATDACGTLVPDLAGSLGELYVIKTHNPGGGPDEHQDWLFDLTSKAGYRTQNTDIGGPQWNVPDDFHHNAVPPEEAFAIVTFPNGYLAIDSVSMRGAPESMGIVQRQRIGNSLPVGVAAGIGLVLPGNASPYTAGIRDRSGALALYPHGTMGGINVAFAPVAELNSQQIGASGCTIGGDVQDEMAQFGLIAGYNAYRIPGDPGVIPQPADFVGAFQYYLPYIGFDLNLPDTLGAAGPDTNGDTLPDGDGTDAPSDSLPNDLAGLQNPNGIPHDGDEVLIYQDSWLNPDGTPRATGTGPDLTGRQGYWYAFQPVLFAGPSDLGSWDGLGFSQSDQFVGTHCMDLDGDGQHDAIDLDLDGSADFYSPQEASGQNGLGLTNGGLPLLSPPVFGRANPLVAGAPMTLTATFRRNDVELTLSPGLEPAGILGYDIRRLRPTARLPINSRTITSIGGEGNTYQLTDRLPSLRHLDGLLLYQVDVIKTSGQVVSHGPFLVEAPETLQRRSR